MPELTSQLAAMQSAPIPSTLYAQPVQAEIIDLGTTSPAAVDLTAYVVGVAIFTCIWMHLGATEQFVPDVG